MNDCQLYACNPLAILTVQSEDVITKNKGGKDI